MPTATDDYVFIRTANITHVDFIDGVAHIHLVNVTEPIVVDGKEAAALFQRLDRAAPGRADGDGGGAGR